MLARVEQMKAIQAELDLFPMVLAEDFDYRPFWGAVVGAGVDDAEPSASELPRRLQVCMSCECVTTGWPWLCQW